MKRFLRSLHRVLGLTVGLWAALTALTGSVLVFSDEIDAALNPHLMRVAPHEGARDLDAAVESVRARFASEGISSVVLPRAADAPLVARLGDGPDTEVFVNPYTAEILGSRPYLGGVMGFLWDLHVHLLAGEAGETVAGVLGLLLIAMVVTGLVLWWPRRGRVAAAFRLRRAGSAAAFHYDLHKLAGAVTAPLVLVLAVTGAMLVFHHVTSVFLLKTLGGPEMTLPQEIAQPPEGARMLPLSRLLAAAVLSGARPVSVKLPGPDGGPVIVRQRFPTNTHPNGRTFVAVDPYTAERLHVHDWRRAGQGVRAADYKYPLHIGTAFGLPGRLLVLATGLVPALLFVTGGYVWWRRRRQGRPRPVRRPRRGHGPSY